MKKKVLLTSIVVIILCMSLIAGSTFALFTSGDSVNIAVTAGKVKLTASIADRDLELYSIGDYMGDGVTIFENGGTAAISVDRKTLTLDRVTPGDEVRFDIQMFNDSNVHIVYRVQYEVTDPIDNKFYAFGSTIWQEWKIPATAEEKYRTSPVSVLLDVVADNDYQEKQLEIAFIVEAYQANADVYDSLLANNNAAKMQNALMAPEGGVVDGNSESISIAPADGCLMLTHNNPVTLQNVTINAEDGAIAAIAGNCVGNLELGTGTVINTNNNAGVFYLFNDGDVVLDSGARINASGDEASCLRFDSPSGTVNVYLNGSDILNPTNGAIGIWLTCGGGVFNFYVESEADYNAYKAMVVELDQFQGTNTLNWYINGVLVP